MISIQRGFFVTEFLVYLALSAFIGLFMTRFLFSTTAQLRTTTAQTERIATLYGALDALAYDLERAPDDLHSWRELQPHELAWQEGASKIRWYISGGTLKRSVKKYDQQAQQWKRSVTHIALEGVQSWTCTPQRDANNIQAITITLISTLPNDKKYTCRRTIPLTKKVVA